jgi:hypothetical protein
VAGCVTHHPLDRRTKYERTILARYWLINRVTLVLGEARQTVAAGKQALVQAAIMESRVIVLSLVSRYSAAV